MYNLLLIVPLLLVYLELSSNFELSNVVVGLLIVSGILLLIRPRRRPMAWRRLPSAIVALIKYVVILAYDLIMSGIQVARIVLDPALPIQQGIVAIPSECESELGSALSAHAITLTPGELVIETDEQGVMYTHCLDATKSEQYVAEAQKMRRDLLEKIFS
jgi:multicomponent Na+:H+ antiporter subunit E